MKINNLHVRGFGKIKDFDAGFSDGLNIVYGLNESGKSTLMSFIKAMFYGLRGGRSGTIKKYQPWESAFFGGYINFELENGSCYRLDRSFDSNAVKLYDGLFNDITGQFYDGKSGTEAAEKLLGINENLFEKTVYISQEGTKIENSASRELINRISNISQSGSEDISIKKAVAVLKEALKQHVGTDKSYTRPLDLISKRLQELNAEKTAIKLQKRDLADENAVLTEISKEIYKLEKKEKLISMIAELSRFKEKIEILYRKNEEICFAEDAIKQCSKDIDSMEKEKVEIEEELTEKSHPISLWLITLGTIILMALGTYILKRINPLIVVPYVIFVLFIALMIYKSSLLKKFPESTGHILNQQASNIKERINNSNKQHDELLKRLEGLKAGFEASDIPRLESSIDIVSEKILAARKMIDNELSAAEKKLIDNIMDKYSDESGQEVSVLNEFIAAQLQSKRLEQARLEEKIRNTYTTQNLDMIDAEIDRLKQQKKSLEQRGEAINIAMSTLEDAAGYVQKKYVPVMNKVFSNIFSGITDNKYFDVRAGDNLNIMLNNPGTDTIIPVSLLSSGTIDQLYLSLRLAISETLLKTNERLPLIMDESFAQYDDERTINTLKYIYEISKQQQVIIFTCKQQEVDLISSKYPCKICSLT